MDTFNTVVDQAVVVFGGAGGINDQLTAMALNLSLPALSSVLKLSAPIELYEKTTTVAYPIATVYCERVKNSQAEKFRMFSGSAALVLEIRISGARAELLDTELSLYVEAACHVLDASRGPWTGIGTYAGAYDIKFQPTRAGGKHFTKSAQIEFEIHISR